MDESPLEGLSSLVQLSGVSVPARARFIGEAMVSSTLSSVTLGLTCGILSAATPVGPLLPFLMGSWTGYTLGLVNHWRTARRVTLHYARNYPTLLAHSLTTERFIVVPTSILKESEQELLDRQSNPGPAESQLSDERLSPMEAWIQTGGIGRMSWSILAAQSCRANVEELQRQQRQKLMDEHNERFG